MVARSNPNYGRGVVEIEDWVDADDVLERLKATFSSKSYVAPRLPRTAMDVLTLSRRANVSFQDVAKVLEKDAILCGDVLRVAQSPMYASRVRITSILQALTRLGLSAVRDLVLQVAMNSRVFRAKPYQKVVEALHAHGTAVAYASRVICRFTSLDAEYAFLCGLLHDVGKVGALIAISEQSKNAPTLADVWHAIDEVHSTASETMVQQWDLPPEVAMVVGAHHTVRIQGYAHPLAAAVCLADRLALEAGFVIPGVVSSGHGYGEMGTNAILDCLNLTEKQFELVKNDVNKALLGVAEEQEKGKKRAFRPVRRRAPSTRR